MSAATRLGRGYFDEVYRASRDPWGFETSAYEREKYADTLAALEGRRYAHGLEVGCSIGVLTVGLADRCERLLAVDVSERAVAEARHRLRGRTGVRVERRSLPEDMPDETFDLIVCSEVLYYLSRELLVDALTTMENHLRPGGSLVAVHWRPRTRTYPLQGEQVHALLREHFGREPNVCRANDRYLLDRFDLTP